MPEYPLERRRARGPFLPQMPTPPSLPREGRKSRAEYIAALREQINLIPGARATGFGEFLGFHLEARSVRELIERLLMLPEEIQTRPAKSVCEGEPVRIT